MNKTKKTYLLPQELIEKVRKTFKVKTETEAIVRAMEEVVFRQEVSSWHQKNSGQLKVRDLYGS